MSDELRRRVTESLPEADAGAGFAARSTNKPHIGGVKHGPFAEALRILAFTTYILLIFIAIHITQFVGAPLYFINKDYYYAWMAVTKEYFGVVNNTMTQWFNPTIVRISGDASVRGQLWLTKDGRLESSFPDRLIMIANHQLYTDWLYLWWTSYTSTYHGHIYIILKESLKYIPFIGPGMMFFGFIFMARNWAKDKPRIQHRLDKLRTRTKDPMWLLVFPEGTNLSGNTRKKSVAFAEKAGLKDMKHCLLPRSTGMQFCLEELKETVDWVYDCTIAYEGIPQGEYGQDIYTLRSTFFQGRVPPSVNLYWRRFAVSSIPVSNAAAFEQWIRDRWIEKDRLLEQFSQTGRFPADDGDDYVARGALKTVEAAPGMETKEGKEVKLGPGGYRYLESEVRNKYTGEWLIPVAPLFAYYAVGWVVYQLWKAVVG